MQRPGGVYDFVFSCGTSEEGQGCDDVEVHTDMSPLGKQVLSAVTRWIGYLVVFEHEAVTLSHVGGIIAMAE